jgi:putative phosphoribosyl transferase
MNPMTTIQEVHIPAGAATVVGDLRVPPRACGLVIFVHGGGSGRFSVRNRPVAEYLDDRGFATLMLDLLTPDEEMIDGYTAEYRFDIPRLARRIEAAVDWVSLQPAIAALPIGCFGASTGAAAALMAAAHRPATLLAVVSRGGRPDLAGTVALEDVEAATLLIVGGQAERAIEMARWTMRQLHAPAKLEIVPGATGLFEEAGALDRVGRATTRWFGRYLAGVALVAAAG